jgi:hypothetical protein
MVESTVDLYRPVRRAGVFKRGVIQNGRAVEGVLYPDFDARTYFSNKLQRVVSRPPDVSVDADGGVAEGSGPALFDRNGVFGRAAWHYFTIPQGTPVDYSLVVRHTGRNARLGAEHYQIEVRTGGTTVAAYKGALDNLARAAVVKLYEDARK